MALRESTAIGENLDRSNAGGSSSPLFYDSHGQAEVIRQFRFRCHRMPATVADDDHLIEERI